MAQAARHEQQDPRPQAGSRDTAPPLWEWVAAAAGLLLVLASVAVLAYHAWTGEAEQPRPVVQVLSIERQAAGYLVTIRVRNQARATAAALHLTGQLRQGAEILEERELELQYLPGGSAREGGLFFSRDPRQHDLTWAFGGYERP